jgi:exopolysaccharide biosynthesis WecB/TagA/CpsF family protein
VDGIDVAVRKADSVVALCRDAVDTHSPLTVAFANAHSVNTARADPTYRAALGRMLVLNDGVGLDVASRLLFGGPFPENLNGTDLTPKILAALSPGTSLFLIGAKPGVAARAGEVIERRWPHLSIAGTRDGFFGEADEGAVVREIEESGASAVLVAMGNPRQEIWADRYADRLRGLVLCIGAWFDFATGEVARAPLWVRRVRLEWAYRLAQEPRRLWRRYLIGNLSFLASVTRQKFAGQRAADGVR